MKGETFFGHQVGDKVGRLPLARGAGKNIEQGHVDPHQQLVQMLVVEALPFAGDIDDAAGIDDIVRSIEDAALQQLQAVAFLGKLVIGRTGDDAGFKSRNGLVVEDRAKSARGKHIDRLNENVRAGDSGGTQIFHCGLHLFGVDITDPEFGSGRNQMLGEPIANVAQPLYRDP